jgi:hypothetical protein
MDGYQNIRDLGMGESEKKNRNKKRADQKSNCHLVDLAATVDWIEAGW